MRNFLLVLIFATAWAIPAWAHPPSKVDVAYDQALKQVKAIIMHDVSNPAAHYIFKADLIINGKIVQEQKFERQQDNSQEKVVFDAVELRPGDTVEVAGYCNISGKRSGSIKAE